MAANGWWRLLAIHRDARAEYRAERRDPPLACPFDGEPLQSGPGGTLHCPFDGWTWPKDPDPLRGV